VAECALSDQESYVKILIIGGVAAGATAAARARRLREDADITIVERGPYVSYANCGLPYFLSGEIRRRSHLLLQTPESFDALYNVRVLVNTEAVAIDRSAKQVTVRNAHGESRLPYDRLILAQGGSPILPPIPGIDAPHVFRLWTVPDMDRLHDHLKTSGTKSAVVVGGGFIGLEMVEAFTKRGVATTVVEMLPTVMATMDREFGALVAGELRGHGVQVLTDAQVVRVLPQRVELADGRQSDADVVLFSVGVRPELALAQRAGLEIGAAGGLRVDQYLRTSDPDIFAAGDMVEVVHRVSSRQVRVPLAGPANRQGRIAASNALGGKMPFAGSLGTNVVKIFDATAAMTGLGEKAARDAGFDIGVSVIHKEHHADYYPGAKELSLKLIFDRSNARLLGGQAFGHGGVEKRIDVLATALVGKLSLHDLAELDLAYAPPYSSANDPVNLAAFVGLNDISQYSPLITAAQLKAELASASPPVLLDVRTLREYRQGHVKGALQISIDDVRFELGAIPKQRRVVVYCRSGYRAHLGLRILRQNGFADVANLTGGYLSILNEGGFDLEAV
jgi:NADPH-dependent 2,4-dienoyl-CoA reductase/sulfur reductase-like enzyme/rhodanese-related sulfurtransferase